VGGQPKTPIVLSIVYASHSLTLWKYQRNCSANFPKLFIAYCNLWHGMAQTLCDSTLLGWERYISFWDPSVSPMIWRFFKWWTELPFRLSASLKGRAKWTCKPPCTVDTACTLLFWIYLENWFFVHQYHNPIPSLGPFFFRQLEFRIALYSTEVIVDDGSEKWARAELLLETHAQRAIDLRALTRQRLPEQFVAWMASGDVTVWVTVAEGSLTTGGSSETSDKAQKFSPAAALVSK
jgi:hypothetical protein